MRIVFFVDVFPSVSETFVLAQITGLLELGHDVDVIAANRPEPGAPEHPDVERYALRARTRYLDLPPESGYWELPVRPITGRTWPPGSAASIPNALRVARALPAGLRGLSAAPRLAARALRPSEYGYQASSLSALYRLAALARLRGSYDVLHAHFGPIANAIRFARDLWRAPLVTSFHGYDFSMWPRRHGDSVYRRLFAEGEAFTVNSEYSRQRLLALGCPAGRLHKLPAPLRVSDFPFRERAILPGDTIHLLTVGRLVEKKGLEYAIRAVARVREAHPRIRYDVIGEGPMRPHLERLIGELGLRCVVALRGARSRTEIRRSLADAHLFLLSSVTAADGDVEGQGVVLQEAQACGLPVLATDHDGFSESIVPGRSGFLVPERDVEALASRLLYMIGHPGRWPEMGRAGRKHVEESYDAPRLNRRLVELYERVCASHG